MEWRKRKIGFFLLIFSSYHLQSHPILGSVIWAIGAESHGGNPNPQILFREARSQAAAILSQIDRTELSGNPSTSAAQWVIAHLPEWGPDILNSPHRWPLSDKEDQENLRTMPAHLRSRSAYTQIAPLAEILFSYSMVQERVRTPEQAVQVLLHESCHHLGLTDEAFIDTIVDLVYSAWEKHRVPDDTILDMTASSANTQLFPPEAAKLCANMAFASIKMECLRTIRFGKFDADALALCGSLHFGADGNACLATIKDKLFQPSDVRECERQSGARTTIQCLAGAAVATERFPFLPSRSTPWVTLYARNYDGYADASRAIREQAKLVCEGWTRIRWEDASWPVEDCVRSHQPVGRGSISLPFEQVRQISDPSPEYFYHCTVRVRCMSPEKPATPPAEH